MFWGLVHTANQLALELEADQRRSLAVYRAEGQKNAAQLQEVLAGRGRYIASPHNCRNCGAPPEPVCSYCGTKA
jgi:hypothetical protein